ncbi:hypothetical protein ACFL2T_05450 [Elusimicrobiota bacterium]
MPMWFKHVQAREFLFKQGEVYTLRPGKRKRDGRDTLVEGPRFGWNKLGSANVRFIKEIWPLTPMALRPYVRKSGLPSGRAWIEAFFELNKNRKPAARAAYLYHVKLLGTG